MKTLVTTILAAAVLTGCAYYPVYYEQPVAYQYPAVVQPTVIVPQPVVAYPQVQYYFRPAPAPVYVDPVPPQVVPAPK
jgi:hypothetical protein